VRAAGPPTLAPALPARPAVYITVAATPTVKFWGAVRRSPLRFWRARLPDQLAYPTPVLMTEKSWGGAEVDGLKRKLMNKLAPEAAALKTDWEV